jgi:hypothetical protein
MTKSTSPAANAGLSAENSADEEEDKETTAEFSADFSSSVSKVRATNLQELILKARHADVDFYR